MRTRALTWTLLALLAAPPARAAAPTMETKTLTLEGAEQVLHAAMTEAQSLGSGGAIAVVDAGGNLVALARLDHTFPAGAEVSIGKARTAARFRRPTSFFEDVIAKGRYSMTALDDFTPLQGGVPILVGDELVGAVGVSGASSAAVDTQIAETAAAALSAQAQK